MKKGHQRRHFAVVWCKRGAAHQRSAGVGIGDLRSTRRLPCSRQKEVLRWVNEAIFSEADLAKVAFANKVAPARDLAAGFLLATLEAGGPQHVRELVAAAEALKIGRTALYRARRMLDVCANAGIWSLPT